MRDTKNAVYINFIKPICFAVSGIQILLGLGWMLLNITGFQIFGVGEETWGYSIRTLIYLIQLIIGYFSIRYLLAIVLGCQSQENKLGMIDYETLWLMSIPPVMQSYLALTGTSLLASALCLLTGGVIHMLQIKENNYKFRGVLNALLLVILMIGVTYGYNLYSISKDSETGKVPTVSSLLVSRFAWPNFGTNYYFWSEEVKTVMSETDAALIDTNYGAVENELRPMFEDAVGTKQAGRLYRQIAGESLKDRTKEVSNDMLEDFKEYLIPTAGMLRHLCGLGESLTGWNYSRMTGRHPQYTAIYYRYGMTAAVMTSITALVCLLYQLIFRFKANRKLRNVGYLTIPLLIASFINTMAGNRPVDEQKALYGFLFMGILCIIMERGKTAG